MPLKESDCTESSWEEVLGSRVYSIDEIMINVTVGRIDPKKASEILQEFATALPLQEYNLDHMKRVRRNMEDRDVLEILICPARCIDDVPIFLKEKCIPNTLRTTKVPKIKPMTRPEYEEWGRDWPTMFRPNAVDKEREKGFTKSEITQHMHFMTQVEKDAEDIKNQNQNHNNNYNQNQNGGLLEQNSDVTASTSDSDMHTPDLDFTNSDWYINCGGVVVNPQNSMVSNFK